MKRRQFLSLSATLLLPGLPAVAAGGETARWSGYALGAEVAITLRGPAAGTAPALAAAEAAIRSVEARFSLYDPASDLSRLNRDGRLAEPDPGFLALAGECSRIWQLTGGRFDPTVQGLWGSGGSAAAIGWDRVQVGPEAIILGEDQQVTFNGIAQGYAADLVADLLTARGFGDLLVDMGEFAARGGPWRIGLADPAQGFLGTRTLTDGAVATSSPRAMLLAGGSGHILDPRAPERPLPWSTVSVEAPRAAFADGLSTGICCMSHSEIAALLPQIPGVRITLVDAAGNLETLAG